MAEPSAGSKNINKIVETSLIIGPGKKRQFKKSKKTFKKNKYPDHSYTKRAGGRRKTVNIKSNRSKIERRAKKQKKRITKKANRYDKKIGKTRD